MIASHLSQASYSILLWSKTSVVLALSSRCNDVMRTVSHQSGLYLTREGRPRLRDLVALRVRILIILAVPFQSLWVLIKATAY